VVFPIRNKWHESTKHIKAAFSRTGTSKDIVFSLPLILASCVLRTQEDPGVFGTSARKRAALAYFVQFFSRDPQAGKAGRQLCYSHIYPLHLFSQSDVSYRGLCDFDWMLFTMTCIKNCI
jgi:hypothetical protein